MYDRSNAWFMKKWSVVNGWNVVTEALCIVTNAWNTVEERRFSAA